ncbi:MarP family serine protease [Natronoglycomyces albus]|uniref:MarP family serine protease n=1 Tax=Natronoglycomyces albus TaxID=2811108 RepID=A0A895XUE0_9ACTN|nr:MarP family serine protease [Natronoglycomyces albus]
MTSGGLVVDVIIIVLALLFAIHGYRQGFIVSAATFLGFLGGALLGVQIAPLAVDLYVDPLAKLIVALLVVFTLALLGQAVATFVGLKLRKKLPGKNTKRLDQLGGPLVSVATVLLVTWMVAAPLAMSGMPAVASAVRHSFLVGGIDQHMPSEVRGVYDAMRESLNTSDIPDVFGGVHPTQVRDVDPPNGELADDPAAIEAQSSVLKVLGSAPSCERHIEGSSFVYGPELVATNAHVVAGTDAVQVEYGDRRWSAEVVVFDSNRDLAVLHVPGLPANSLPLASSTVSSGDDAIVVGYPGGGGYTASPARVRDAQTVSGPDIYSASDVTREVYQLYANIIGGNSGGPLLNPDGEVVGVIFAAAVDDPNTGYALTLEESRPILDEGLNTTSPVSTGACTQ